MSAKSYNFSGKVVLITGSSSGIGAEVARQFARSGARVVITGHEAADVEKISAEIAIITGHRPLNLVGNLTDDTFAEKLVAETVQTHGRIDILINNAGRLCPGGGFLDPSLMSKYELVIGLNVRAVFKMIHLCVPHLEAAKGNIINTASIAGFSPCCSLVYNTSKSAVNMLTKCAAIDLGRRGIRVNSINPGVIRTPIGTSMGVADLWENEATNPLLPHTIMKRFGETVEVARLILFLASAEASYITGGNYLVDGGYMCL